MELSVFQIQEIVVEIGEIFDMYLYIMFVIPMWILIGCIQHVLSPSVTFYISRFGGEKV